VYTPLAAQNEKVQQEPNPKNGHPPPNAARATFAM
jgi:hypothetical protein